MATDKENIADGLIVGAGSSFKASSLSPKKTAKKKTRSKSIGPGGLGALEDPPLKESHGNRRKSAFIPAVKSILASNDEDEKKRREARRKSLARRRVSFAPEATLHTWDVVEYMRDATSSSASSEATRRASGISSAPGSEQEAEEQPSTPPERVEEPELEPGSSPANQRDLHQKKNRRSSGIPPMNFNNPDDIYSSSPLSGDNASPGGIEMEEDAAEEDARESSPFVNDDSQSSARLDAALRQASTHAETQRLDLDEGDMSMVMAEDDVTAAFKPWTQQSQKMPTPQQENDDPFAQSSPGEQASDDDGDDMSMDMTCAVGRIVSQPAPQSPGSDDMTMDLTMPLGSIQSLGPKESTNRRKSLKRRVSMLDASQGSPSKRSAGRRTSLRQRNAPDESPASDDQTMDFTLAIGAIKSQVQSKPEQDNGRRNSVDTCLGGDTMDFTLAVGTIKSSQNASAEQEEQESDSADEDMSMEFTKIVGPGIKHLGKVETPEKAPIAPLSLASKVKTPTPKKSPNKSPGRPRSVSPQKTITRTPQKSPGQLRRSLNTVTPEALTFPKQSEEYEPSPFVRRTPQSISGPAETVSMPMSQPRDAPLHIPNDPIAAPILNRRRSSLSAVQFSPLATAKEGAAQEPTLKGTSLLSNNIKLLSTPRKQSLASPVKRGLTPKKSQTPQKLPTPKQKTPTPKKVTPRRSLSPKKRVAFGMEPENEDHVDELAPEEEISEIERISLQDFLEMTRIRFMDLSTTKRRHTAAPATFHDKEVDDREESLDSYVTAGACTLPEFELYQHACHEMKKYISSGRGEVREMEANVMEDNPLLFSEYLTAPPDQRAIMDNQFKNLKTNARLEARGEWYNWRSTLLHDLKVGLLGTLDGFKRDDLVLTKQEGLLDVVLPPLTEKQEKLNGEYKQLQQRHDELNSCDREELERARDQLVTLDTELEEKRKLVAQLQRELDEKETLIEATKERKIQCVQETKEAERVREECRGWSTTEVNDLKIKVSALEQAHGWAITSASSNMITMSYLNDLELYFQPSAFATGANTPNGSISLSYVGDSTTPHPRPLTTSKRFFLQMIRAQLHCIPQSQTRISALLSLVKNGWASALAVAEGVRWLEHSNITEESILSDERMAISSYLLLPTLQTKVKLNFEISVSLGMAAVETEVGATAEVVYGEKYGEEKMGAFLREFCGNQVKDAKEMSVWADAVTDLAARLRKIGRKGERA